MRVFLACVLLVVASCFPYSIFFFHSKHLKINSNHTIRYLFYFNSMARQYLFLFLIFFLFLRKVCFATQKMENVKSLGWSGYLCFLVYTTLDSTIFLVIYKLALLTVSYKISRLILSWSSNSTIRVFLPRILL
jgi:hypothetical protein